MPRVSVILPVFNSEAYLSLSIGSLLLQDFPDFEIVAVDDGSTDSSLDILHRIAARDSRIRVLQRPHQGLIASLNDGIDAATGDYIARMDADDIAYPQRFSRQLEAFEADPGLAVCGTGFDLIHSDSRALATRGPHPTDSRGLQVLARFQAALRHPTVMFRRSVIPEGELRYDPDYPCAEDYDLLRRLAETSRLCQLPEPLLAYRLHDSSITATRPEQMFRTHARILEENFARHYPSCAGTGFGQLLDEVSGRTVGAGAELIRRLDALGPHQPAEDRFAFGVGTTLAFHFLLAHIYRGDRLDLAGDFVTQSDSWHRVPWPLQLFLSGAAALPMFARHASAAIPRVSHFARTLRSRPLSRVVPDYDALLRVARDGDPAPQGPARTRPAPDRPGHAAGRVIFVQPALPSYRLDYFERLARSLGPRFRVYHSAEDMGVLTQRSDLPWSHALGPMRRPVPGLEWQPGAAGLAVGPGDVLVVCGAPRCLSTLVLLVRARLQGARTVWWGQFWSASSRQWRFRLRMVLLRLAERVWFYTDEEVSLYQRSAFSGAQKVASISNGLRLDEVRAQRRPFRPEERPLRIFFIGRLTAKARLDLLLRALALPDLADVELAVIGDGEEGRRLRDLAASLGLAARVRWHGATVDEAGIAAVANTCRVFAYPGGVGLSLVHAMAYGLPAVLHDDRWTHMPEIAAFQSGRTGVAFHAGDPASLAKAIAGLIRDDDALRAASARAIRIAEERFTTGEMARRTLRLLGELGVTLPEEGDAPVPAARAASLAAS